jgi:hypothetical protein
MSNAGALGEGGFCGAKTIAGRRSGKGPVMSRRMLTLIAAVSFAGLSGVAFADDQVTTDSRGQGDFQIQWERLVSKNMDLSDTERARFDPLYHEYRSAVAKMDNRFVDLLKTYTENYRSLDDSQAVQLLKDYVEQRAERVQLDQNYIPRFQAIMSPKDVVRLFQIENKLRIKVSAYFAERVPLIEGDGLTVTPSAGGTETPSGSSPEH